MNRDNSDKNKNTSQFVAKTLFGFEEMLAEELKNLGADNIKILHRAVSFTGDKKLMYEANYKLRTALRILKRIYSFRAKNDKDLYAKVRDVYWDKYFTEQDTIAVDSAVSSDYFTHSQYVSQKVKDAIVDQFREKTGKRPSVDLENPGFRINIHIFNEDCTLSLDSSGDSLHKRGYRLQMNEAPLSEVLAAGLILLSGWDERKTFIDPMCGSGTILIEAAMIATHTPAGFFRKNFGFMHWKDFDDKLWDTVKSSEIKNENNELKIIGADISPQAIEVTKKNIRNAGFAAIIKPEILPFEQVNPPQGGGTVIFNPPYGERIKTTDLEGFYKMIGDTLKKKYAGYEAWILSANMQALKHVGLHSSKKISLMNGPLECKFQRYTMYEGSRKTSSN